MHPLHLPVGIHRKAVKGIFVFLRLIIGRADENLMQYLLYGCFSLFSFTKGLSISWSALMNNLQLINYRLV